MKKSRVDCLLVGVTENLRTRIIDQLEGLAKEIIWAADIYDLMASAAILGYQGKSILAIIRVDCLTTDQMQIFQMLKTMDHITSLAVSTTGWQTIMSQTRANGADLVCREEDLPHVLSQINHLEIHSRQPACMSSVEEITQSLDESIEEMISQTMESAQQNLSNDIPAATPPQINSPKQPSKSEPEPMSSKTMSTPEQSEQPLLTQEELDALLG
ncbi:MAG: hypothetical protein JW860_02725 [Sedimentisphaerales bacterium]|nr:hypothetical protein [Sedimentisphaerales bacterium]